MNSPQANRGVLRKNCLLSLGACAGAFLLVPLGFLLFVLLFYVEEDWRGARAWDRAKADIAAQGESIDPAKFIPAPVPTAENFGALPYFKVVTGPGGLTGTGTQHFAISDNVAAVADSIATSGDSSMEKTLPYLGNWLKGEPPASDRFTEKFVAYLKRTKPEVSVSRYASPFDIFEQICPALADLRSNAQSHSECVFPEDIDYTTPAKQTFGADTSLIRLVKVLLYDADLAMLAGHPDIAIADFRVGWRVTSGVQKRPFYVANLVASGLILMQLRLIAQGLADHTWNDTQLTELESEMDKLNYLAQSRRQLAGEIACYSLPMTDYYAKHRAKWAKDINLMRSFFSDDEPVQERAFALTYRVIPDGWFALAKAEQAKRKMNRVRSIDLASGQVHPYPDPEESSDFAIRWLDFILPDLNLTKGIVSKIAYTEAQVDEARIACRLERYRLAHHAFPPTLDDLARAYGPLPRDVIGGNAYHYRLNPNQTYLLYSVGWNQRDDLGATGTMRNDQSPDWIWTSYPDKK